MDYILAYDFGTSGVKAALVDFDGNLLGDAERGYPLLTGPNGFAEQDPADYWKAVCAATKAVVKKVGIAEKDVVGMSFSTQGLGIIPIDAQGNILHNNISWIDSRARKQADEINEKMGSQEFGATDVIPKYLWIKQNMPELYEKTAYFLDCTGYLNFMATGVICIDYSGKAPYHSHPEVAAHRLKQYEAAGLDTAKCPPLIPCTGFVGNLTEKAARELGVTTRVEVYMGVVDVTCAALGAGCCKEGDAHVYLGTSSWLTAIIGYDRLENTGPGIWQLHCCDPTKQIYGGCIQSACMALNWAIDQFYHMEKILCETEKMDYFTRQNIFALVDREVDQVPAGSEGLLATPWLMGEGCPISDEKAKATFIGASTVHTRRHFLRAVMESICYSLRMEMDDYKQDVGRSLTKVNAIGGGAQSDPWLQMMADVLGVPVTRTKNCRHSGAIGSAAIVCIGMGVYKMEEIDRFVQLERTFEPRKEQVAVYNKQYKIWKKLHPALKEIFAELY
ncbi:MULTISPECIES: xylulokinase [Anaerotruncus]|uniref:xylulokinase n=1 Tax=Anaerotruncus TaxID=244127 RepID=UPI000E52328D|nr:MULTISPECIES: FGGY-family carbohydrate kinase [Anaerotruncus]RGX55184.1 hypothetical protein DWV16_10500 [Anaerotruncus sp. AF02-27]